MKAKHFLAAAFCLATLLGFSCSKDDTTTPAGTGVNGQGTFTWVEGNGGAGTAIVCDSAYASAQFKTIYAFKGSGSNRYFYEINLSSLSAANYSITATGANQVAYQRNGAAAYDLGTAGAITITANASSKLSGTGVVTMPSTGDRVYITMNNVPVR